MIDFKNAKRIFCFALIAISLFLGRTASADGGGGHTIGNGGGSWVCRETDGKIRWIRLVDLFEATEEFELTLADYPGTVGEVLDRVRNLTRDADHDLFNAVSPYLHELNGLDPNPPHIIYTDHIVVTIDDSLYRIKPAKSECAGGSVAYEQVVNYKNDGNILVASELVQALSAEARAALVLHEAIYKYRRDIARDTDSVITRRIVGLLFSTLPPADLRKELASLGEKEIGSLGMKFSLIQPSSFKMGNPPYYATPIPFFEEPPQRIVTLTQPFEIQTTTVTQVQYTQVMGVNPSRFKESRYCEKSHEVREGIEMCPNHPVDSVSYNDVQAFLKKLNSMHQDEYIYRLPTEAEWEFAARGGTSTLYFFGNDPEGKNGKLYLDYGWFDPAWGQTHEVAQKKPNSFGLYDMVGDITQWVSDWSGGWNDASVTDPVGPPSGTQRVLRPAGCMGYSVPANLSTYSWSRGLYYERSGSRGAADPASHLYCVGFRLVRTPRE